MDMDPSPSVCRLHPGVAVTGFCPACLRDRLAGLHPASAADLRRCKSFSYARSAAALEPQRRSCDLFRHQQGQGPIAVAAAEEDLQLEAPVHHQPKSSSRSLGGLLGKKLQQWRRKSKKQEQEPVPVPMLPPDPDPRRASASWDRSGPVPALARLPTTTTMLEEEEGDHDMNMMAPPVPVPRSDGQIPVEEDCDDYNHCYSYYDNAAAAVPGGSAQTRDYYLDSSSSSRRRRSVDRSTTSARNSFSLSDANSAELPLPTSGRMTNNGGNTRVSPVIAAERLYHYHHEAQSVLVHHHHRQYRRADEELLQGPSDDFSRSFGSAFRDHRTRTTVSNSRPKKGIKGWSIWGLIHKKSKPAAADLHANGNGPFFSSAEAATAEHPWPELRARGYNGQMLRCNSSISARSSFSGGASAMIGGSGRRSISGVDMRDGKNNGSSLLDGRRARRDEVLLERNMSIRSSSSYSRSAALAVAGHDLDPPMAMAPPMGMQYHHHHHQLSRPPNIPRHSSSKHAFSSFPRRSSTLGL